MPSYVRDRQPSAPLNTVYRPVDRGLAERLYKMFRPTFNDNWKMPDLSGPEYSQTPPGPGFNENSGGNPYRTMEYRVGRDDNANPVQYVNAANGGQDGDTGGNLLPEGTVITSNDAGANMKPLEKARDIPDVTDRLHALMAEYEEKYKDIKDKPIDDRLKIFHSLVQDHGILDLKRQPGWDSPKFVYNGEIVNNDVPGNILYGYLGKHFDFPDTLLYAAAGYNQMSNDSGRMREEGKNPLGVLKGFNLNSFGDDPRDTARIRQGIEVWNKKYLPKPPPVYGD